MAPTSYSRKSNVVSSPQEQEKHLKQRISYTDDDIKEDLGYESRPISPAQSIEYIPDNEERLEVDLKPRRFSMEDEDQKNLELDGCDNNAFDSADEEPVKHSATTVKKDDAVVNRDSNNNPLRRPRLNVVKKVEYKGLISTLVCIMYTLFILWLCFWLEITFFTARFLLRTVGIVDKKTATTTCSKQEDDTNHQHEHIVNYVPHPRG